jgi:DNA-binding transcriptional LysR family regulator
MRDKHWVYLPSAAMDVGDVDFKKLWAFYLVAKHGNLRLAASRLNQTIPAVSAKLRKLEREIDATLFERLPNRLMLTALGERFFVEVEALFARASDTMAVLSSAEEPRGRLRVSMGTDLTWYIAPRIGAFVRRYPKVDLSLQIYKGADALVALGKGDLDVSIGGFPKVPRACERTTIVRSSLSLVCPSGHPLLRKPSPKLEEIARHRLILLQRQGVSRAMVDRAFAKRSIDTGSVIEAANCPTAIALVQKGVGVAIIHSVCLRQEFTAGLQMVELNAFPKIEFSILYRKGGVRSEIMRGLLDEFDPLPASAR